MNVQEVINVIDNLPIRYTERTEPSATTKIAETARLVSPILTAKGLQISNGSTSPSSQRSYARIYLEKVGNMSHDPRHRACQENMIAQFEWKTNSRYGFSPLSAKKIKSFCDDLIAAVEDA